MFPLACRAGIDAREFWYYTLLELNTTVLAYRNNIELRARMDYKLADLIGASVGRLLSKDAKYPTFEQAYPGLGDAGRSEEEERQAKLAKTKAWLLTYANAHNAKIGEVK